MSQKLPPPALLDETRFKCIGDYPANFVINGLDAQGYNIHCPHYKKGDVILCKDKPGMIPYVNKLYPSIWNEETETFLSKYPALFRLLEWHEHRTIEELCSVRFILVLTNDHPIYRIGDQVRVKDYSILTKPLKFDGYMLYDYDPDNIIRVKECMPTTEHLLTPKI